MLFFDDTQLRSMRLAFAQSRWPDFDEPYLLQRAPATLKPYDVVRWDGYKFAPAMTTDAKFASWLITENAVAFALGDDPRHLAAASAWVRAAISTEPWEPQFKGNTDLFHGNLLYALSMFLDLCGGKIDAGFRREIVESLLTRGRFAIAWFVDRQPHLQRYTQNHFYIPIGGLLCAAIVLQEMGEESDRDADPGRGGYALARRGEVQGWIATLKPYLPLMFDALGDDGWFFEGCDYFHYAFIWIVRLAELSERHFDLRVADKPCFTKLKHFLRWTYFPSGGWQFAIGDASSKQWNFSRWSEAESGQALAPDNRLQNASHVLHWVAQRNGDPESRALADEIKSRSNFRWQEGFWCLAWAGAGRDAQALPADCEQKREWHLFDDFGIWAADRAVAEDSRTLRVLGKCGPPMGRSVWKNNQLVHQYDAGHVHPDAGAVWAAIDDVPVLLGPGYLGRKSGAWQNTITIDGRGQQDDRIYHALNPDVVDYARLMRLQITGDASHALMRFAAAYDPKLGVVAANRSIRFGQDDLLFTIDDQIETASPRFIEARFRISDPPTERGADFIRWRVGSDRFELRVASASSPVELIVQIGEVITMNDSGRSGPFEAGDVNQRGWQIIVRPRERATALRTTIAIKLI
ncbi:hypothetical protein BH09PLA1_BH09PLA1_04600 [soil metagenome]